MGQKGPGSSNSAGHKVSWAYRTESSSTGSKSEKSLEFKFK